MLRCRTQSTVIILYLWVFTCHSTHLLWVQLDWVIAQLSLGRSFEVLATNRKIAVSLHPPGEKNTKKGLVLTSKSLFSIGNTI